MAKDSNYCCRKGRVDPEQFVAKSAWGPELLSEEGYLKHLWELEVAAPWSWLLFWAMFVRELNSYKTPYEAGFEFAWAPILLPYLD